MGKVLGFECVKVCLHNFIKITVKNFTYATQTRPQSLRHGHTLKQAHARERTQTRTHTSVHTHTHTDSNKMLNASNSNAKFWCRCCRCAAVNRNSAGVKNISAMFHDCLSVCPSRCVSACLSVCVCACVRSCVYKLA